jgi:GNAT superfamily N-acetyltransferase
VVDVVIRPAGAGEIEGLGEVERDGDRRYAGYEGVPAGFDDVVAPSTLERARHDGRLWVAAVMSGAENEQGSGDGEIIGFALAETLDGEAHLAQLSVRLAFQGRGVGRGLVQAVVAWARDRSLAGVTLCTFDDVGWNRPLYEQLGFVVVPEGQWTPEVRAAFEGDGALGLDLGRRVVMRLAVGTG